jgi:hypothetical protein
MFVTGVRFPEIPFELEAEIRAWFACSNGLLPGSDGCGAEDCCWPRMAV